MKFIVFSKMFKNKTVEELADLALEYGFQGYDLCVRPGYTVAPDNVGDKLPQAVDLFKQKGLCIPMVTGPGDLLWPDDPVVEQILTAMDRADVRLLKLGYFKFDPLSQDYWQEVGKIKLAFERWQKLGQRYQVKICYHTHSHRCMGLNCASLAHLIDECDPKYIGAYIDPGHMTIEGEEFSFGVAMVKNHLSIIGLKDVLLRREDKNGHGTIVTQWVPAGKGVVDWTAVFSELVRIGFEGPLSIHCEFKVEENKFMNTFKQEIAFFKRKLNESLKQK